MRLLPALALLFTLSLGLVGCGENGQKSSGGEKPPAEVSVVTLKAEAVSLTTDLPGRTTPYRIAEVRPQVGGVILQRLFEEGAEVKTGQPLYQIDPAPFEASLASAQATLAHNQASLVSARLLAERNAPLVVAGAVSRQDYDDAVAARGQAEADIASAQAAVKTAKINLDYTKITSPITGRTGRSSVTEGALVTAGQTTPLVTVQQLDPIYVDIVQPSVQILHFRRAIADGMMKSSDGKQTETNLLLEDWSTYPLPGKLQFSEVTVEETTGSITLRAVFPNPERLLLPGMYVHARVQEGVAENSLLVPQRSVTRTPKGDATALVVDVDSKVALRTIKTDRTIGDKWLVANESGSELGQGLRAGDRVIVEGLQKIRPGAPVHATEFSSGPASQNTPAAP